MRYIDQLISDEKTHRSLVMAGCAAAAVSFGYSDSYITHTLLSGMSHILARYPEISPEQASEHYFSGVLGFFSGAVDLSAKAIAELGCAVPQTIANALDQLREFIAGLGPAAQNSFQFAARKSVEFASSCAHLVGGAIDEGKTLIQMIPTDPSQAFSALYNIGQKAIEAAGLAHGLYKAYSWVARKLRGESVKERAPQVTNIQINYNLIMSQDSIQSSMAFEEPNRLNKLEKIVKSAREPVPDPQSTEKRFGSEIISFLQRGGVRKNNTPEASVAP